MIVKGQKINDRYQIIRMIGEGGMANVYLAHDTILDRNVAVKILRGDLADDEKFVRRFQREAISASSLSHPNIVEMYDVGEDDGKYFIVMEFVDGKTLKSLIKRRGKLILSEVIDIMLQLTSGVSKAHDAYIIHRDIKAQNVLILENGTVKITDFGIAIALNSNELTQTNSVMGSVHYLPPEQANGAGATIKSDIYSLGILMYELTTGKLPFKGESPVEIAIKHMKEPIPRVTEDDPDIPQAFENIILKACAKNPKNRYDNVTEMINDLTVCLNEDHKKDRKVSFGHSEKDTDEIEEKRVVKHEQLDEEEPKKSNKVIAILMIVCLLLVLIGLSIVFLLPKAEKEVKVPDVSDISVEQATKYLEDLGLIVEEKEKPSDEIDEDKVVETSPKAGKQIKKGDTVIIYISTGTDKIEIEDYTAQDAQAIKKQLETIGIIASIQTKRVTTDTEYKEGLVIEQSVKPGEMVEKNDIIVLYIPEFYTVYPDFVTDKWTEADAKDFCVKNNINLTVVYEETDSIEEGIVIKQNRAAGVEVYENMTLQLTISKLKEVTEKPNDNKTNEEEVTE